MGALLRDRPCITMPGGDSLIDRSEVAISTSQVHRTAYSMPRRPSVPYLKLVE